MIRLNNHLSRFSGGIPSLNKSHPLYESIAAVVIPGIGVTILKGDGVVNATIGGDIVLAHGPDGPSAYTNTHSTTNAQQYSGNWSKLTATAGYSLAVLYRLNSAPTTSCRVAGNFASLSNGYGFLPSTTNYRFGVSNGSNTVLTGSAVGTGLKFDIGVVDSTNVALYENGRLTAGPTAHGGVTTPTGSFKIGADNGPIESAKMNCYLSILFNKPLNAIQVAEINRDIWSILQYKQVIPLNAPAGGGTTITATVGDASATGTSVLISSSIVSTVGDSAATGISSLISSSIAATVGDAQATGVSAALGSTISCAVGDASATGITASISQTGDVFIYCSVGGALATGQSASINIPTSDTTGGWWNLYDIEMARRERERKKRKKLEEEAEQIQDTIDKELVKALLDDKKNQDRVAELKRLSDLAERHMARIEATVSPEVMKAAEAAITRGNYSAMERFERELRRAKEEEEFLSMAVALLMSQ